MQKGELMSARQVVGLILAILGAIGIIVSLVIGLSPFTITHALPMFFGVILIGVGLVLLKA